MARGAATPTRLCFYASSLRLRLRPNAECQARHSLQVRRRNFDGVAGRIDCGSVGEIGVEAMFRTAPYATDIVALTLIGAWILNLILSRITDTCNLIAHVAMLCWRWTRRRFPRLSEG